MDYHSLTFRYSRRSGTPSFRIPAINRWIASLLVPCLTLSVSEGLVSTSISLLSPAKESVAKTWVSDPIYSEQAMAEPAIQEQTKIGDPGRKVALRKQEGGSRRPRQTIFELLSWLQARNHILHRWMSPIIILSMSLRLGKTMSPWGEWFFSEGFGTGFAWGWCLYPIAIQTPLTLSDLLNRLKVLYGVTIPSDLNFYLNMKTPLKLSDTVKPGQWVEVQDRWEFEEYRVADNWLERFISRERQLRKESTDRLSIGGESAAPTADKPPAMPRDLRESS